MRRGRVLTLTRRRQLALTVNAAQTNTPDYTPFTGAKAACLAQFPARNQGSCGSCYAFAATSAFSLKYCIAAYDAGGSYADSAIPVLTVQNIGEQQSSKSSSCTPCSHRSPTPPIYILTRPTFLSSSLSLVQPEQYDL